MYCGCQPSTFGVISVHVYQIKHHLTIIPHGHPVLMISLFLWELSVTVCFFLFVFCFSCSVAFMRCACVCTYFASGWAGGSGEFPAVGTEQPEGAEAAARKNGQHSHRADVPWKSGELKQLWHDIRVWISRSINSREGATSHLSFSSARGNRIKKLHVKAHIFSLQLTELWWTTAGAQQPGVYISLLCICQIVSEPLCFL